MAADLTPKQQEELHAEALAADAEWEATQRVLAWDRAMNRAFKGILGGARNVRRASLIRGADRKLREES